MALENAKKLVEELQQDQELKGAFEADAAAALAAKDYGCTLEELKEALALTRELDDAELEAIGGGNAKGTGGCSYDFYVQACASTVEEGSWCGSNDWCKAWDVEYQYKCSYGVHGQ